MPERTGLVRRAQARRKCAHRPLELYIVVDLWFVHAEDSLAAGVDGDKRRGLARFFGLPPGGRR
jgi:hypothetical protein